MDLEQICDNYEKLSRKAPHQLSLNEIAQMKCDLKRLTNAIISGELAEVDPDIEAEREELSSGLSTLIKNLDDMIAAIKEKPCKRCGELVSTAANFCYNCGEKIEGRQGD